MGFDQYHEPASELTEKMRTFARMITSLTEEAEAIGWPAGSRNGLSKRAGSFEWAGIGHALDPAVQRGGGWSKGHRQHSGSGGDQHQCQSNPGFGSEGRGVAKFQRHQLCKFRLPEV